MDTLLLRELAPPRNARALATSGTVALVRLYTVLVRACGRAGVQCLRCVVRAVCGMWVRAGAYGSGTLAISLPAVLRAPGYGYSSK